MLEAGVAVTAEAYGKVSTYISNIASFTAIHAMCTPLQVVNLPNILCEPFGRAIAHCNFYMVDFLEHVRVYSRAQRMSQLITVGS